MIEVLKLKLLEAYTRDVGRGVVRIDYDTMDKLECSTGDILEIKDKRKTVAKCLPLYPSDEGKDIIRCDGLIRKNLKTSIGNEIELLKASVKPALEVNIEWLQSKIPLDMRYLADALQDIAITKGDETTIPYFGGRIEIRILKTKPKGYVVINQNTIFTDNKKLEEKGPICPTCGQEVRN